MDYEASCEWMGGPVLDGWNDEWLDLRMDGTMGDYRHLCMVGRMGGYTFVGWKDLWFDLSMDGWMKGWVDGLLYG
jgi:hypothetical protein